MPATTENGRTTAGEEERDFDRLSSGRRRKSDSSPPLIDRVVQSNKEHAVPSAYGDNYEDEEDEWTVLTSRDQDETHYTIEQPVSV